MRGGVGAPAVRDHAARLAAALTSFSLSRWPSENSLLQRLVLIREEEEEEETV